MEFYSSVMLNLLLDRWGSSKQTDTRINSFEAPGPKPVNAHPKIDGYHDKKGAKNTRALYDYY